VISVQRLKDVEGSSSDCEEDDQAEELLRQSQNLLGQVEEPLLNDEGELRSNDLLAVDDQTNPVFSSKTAIG